MRQQKLLRVCLANVYHTFCATNTQMAGFCTNWLACALVTPISRKQSASTRICATRSSPTSALTQTICSTNVGLTLWARCVKPSIVYVLDNRTRAQLTNWHAIWTSPCDSTQTPCPFSNPHVCHAHKPTHTCPTRCWKAWTFAFNNAIVSCALNSASSICTCSWAQWRGSLNQHRFFNSNRRTIWPNWDALLNK